MWDWREKVKRGGGELAGRCRVSCIETVNNGLIEICVCVWAGGRHSRAGAAVSA